MLVSRRLAVYQCCQIPTQLHCHIWQKWRPFGDLPRPQNCTIRLHWRPLLKSKIPHLRDTVTRFATIFQSFHLALWLTGKNPYNIRLLTAKKGKSEGLPRPNFLEPFLKNIFWALLITLHWYGSLELRPYECWRGMVSCRQFCGSETIFLDPDPAPNFPRVLDPDPAWFSKSFGSGSRSDPK
jgi:hypothetical protein